MANELTAPGFETDEGWTWEPAYADRSETNPRTDSWSAQVIGFHRPGIGSGNGYVQQNLSGITNGRRLIASAWIDGDDALNTGNGSDLKIYLDYGGGGGWELQDTLSGATYAAAAAGYVFIDLGAINAEGATPGIRFLADYNTGEAINLGNWYVDDVSLAMAVELAERAVDEVVSTLQSNLATELSTIDGEQNDGITMAAPANADYHKYEKEVIAGSRTQVEVFEQEYETTNPYVDAGSNHIRSIIPVLVRITYFNQDGDTGQTMWTRGRRYNAAVARVIRDNHTLAGDDAVKIAVPTRMAPSVIEKGPSGPMKMQAQTLLEVQLEEIDS